MKSETLHPSPCISFSADPDEVSRNRVERGMPKTQQSRMDEQGIALTVYQRMGQVQCFGSQAPDPGPQEDMRGQ